jgi:hypothetical protein
MRDVERRGWKESKRGEGMVKKVSVSPDSITDEDCFFGYLLDQILRSKSLIGRQAVGIFPFLVAIESGVYLSLSGIQNRADQERGRRNLGCQDIESRNSCHGFFSGKG